MEGSALDYLLSGLRTIYLSEYSYINKMFLVMARMETLGLDAIGANFFKFELGRYSKSPGKDCSSSSTYTPTQAKPYHIHKTDTTAPP